MKTDGIVLVLFPELRSKEGNRHQNNTRASAETIRHESTYIILLHTQHNVSINDDNSDDLCTSSPCLTHSNSFCWWRHNRLPMTSQWPDNCGAITWIMISNSLDIDFIYDDIHDRSCKKDQYLIWRKNSQVSVTLKVMNSAHSDRMIAINLTPPMLVSEIYNVHFIW